MEQIIMTQIEHDHSGFIASLEDEYNCVKIFVKLLFLKPLLACYNELKPFLIGEPQTATSPECLLSPLGDNTADKQGRIQSFPGKRIL